MKDVKEFSKFLREAREKSGLTQSQVAEKLGYSTAQFVSNWERGQSYPPMKTLPTLAQLYKVNTDQLFDVILAISVHTTEQSLRRQYKQYVKRRLA